MRILYFLEIVEYLFVHYIFSVSFVEYLFVDYIYSIEISREWITSGLDATPIFLYVDLIFMPQVFYFFFHLLNS